MGFTLVKWNKLYHYPPSTRSLTDGIRTYNIGKEKLPSVTSILKATQSDEKRASLARWQARVGMDERQGSGIKRLRGVRICIYI